MFLLWLSMKEPNREEISQKLDLYELSFSHVINNLQSLQLGRVSISRPARGEWSPVDIQIFRGHNEGYILADGETAKHLELLLNIGVQIIRFEVNYTYFMFWSTLDRSVGLIYIGDPENVDLSFSLPFLVHKEKLNIEGWYFYISDFNIFRRNL